MATILVVDDSMMVRSTLRRALEGAGYTVQDAADGDLALAALAEEPFLSHPPALMVLDINMPRCSGVEVLERLAATGKPLLPVLVLTTEGQPEVIAHARALGVRGWMLKPVRPDALLAAVRSLTGA